MIVTSACNIKYAVLDSNIIFNECGPHSAGPRGWSPKRIEKRNIAAERWINTMNRKNGFYDKLEESILKEGCRNPILIVAGWCRENKLSHLPIEMQEDHKKILWCGSNGGSRLWVAQKHNLTIPCIISDFVNMFPNELILEADGESVEEKILAYYKDKPKKVTVNMYGVAVSHIPQVHLGEK